MSDQANEIIEKLEAILDRLRRKIHTKVDELYGKKSIKEAEIASSISTDILSALRKIGDNKIKLVKFMELSEKFKDSPEELIYLLSLPDIPAITGSGKRIAEAIAGFRGLGIETIDHKVDEIRYENVSLKEGEHPLSEVSITSFMYRVPPFELTKCTFETGSDKEITDILGSRFVWILKPEEISWDSWNEILQKTTGGRPTSLIKGKYAYEKGLIVPKLIELIDLSAKSVTIEIGGRYPFFLKFGSSTIERETKMIKAKYKLLQYLKNKSADIAESIGPILASWRLRLDYSYFCYKGLGLSTDPFDVTCPFKDRCRLSQERGGRCDGRLFWSGRYNRRRFYPKSYPLRRLRIGKGGLEIYSEGFPFNWIRFAAYEKKKVESRWYAVEIGTWFINARPTVRIFFDTEIGYAIPTSVMELYFDRKWLNEILKDILRKEVNVRKTIALKLILHKALGSTLDYKRLSKTIRELTKKNSKLAKKYSDYVESSEISSELVDFARRVLLHSMEHVLTQFVLEKFAGVDMNFVLTKYYHKYSDKIVLAENAKNGKIGVVDTIVRSIRTEGLSSFLYHFADWLSTYLNFHVNDLDKLALSRMNEAEKTLNEVIYRLERGSENEQRIADKIREMCSKIEKFRKALNASNIELDITLARTVLLAGGLVSETDVEEIGDYFDDILERFGFRLCLDGCNGCVRLERFCGEGVRQILTTSRILLHKFAEYLKNIVVHGLTERSNELGKFLEPILFNPKESIDILCPYISPSYAERLVQLAKNGKRVRVLTWIPKEGDERYEFQRTSLRLFKKNLELKTLSVRVEDRPEVGLIHDKTYIVDNIVLTGSFNLTESGLYRNLERVDIKLHPEIVRSEKRQYEELWEKATDLQNYEI